VKRRAVLLGVTVTLLIIGSALTLIAGQLQRSAAPLSIGDYSHVDIQMAEADFSGEPSNDALFTLIKALCYRKEILAETAWDEKLLFYGRELYARARAETVDLETIDEEQVTLSVLSVLREIGADK